MTDGTSSPLLTPTAGVASPVVSLPTSTEEEVDYSQFIFIPERANPHTTFTPELQWLNTRDKNERTVSYKLLKVNPDGSFNIGPEHFQTTQWAFEQLCARLGIPRPFARKIPADLLLSNIDRLIQEKIAQTEEQLQIHFIKVGQDTVIAGCTKEDYMFVGAVDFLTAVAALDGNGYKLEDLYVGDRLVEVDLLLDNQVITLSNQKQFHVGINLRSSDIGDVNPTTRLLVKDLSTGLVSILSTEWGRVDRVRNKKVSIDRSFINFIGNTRELFPPQPLTSALEYAEKTDVLDAELKNWYDTFNRAIDNKPTIDELLGLSEEQRKEIWKTISNRKKENQFKKLNGIAQEGDAPTQFTRARLSSLVAEYAKDAILEEKEPLRRLAGTFIEVGK